MNLTVIYRHSDVAAARRLAQHLRGQALSVPITPPAPTPASVPAPVPGPTAALSVATSGYEVPSAAAPLNVNVNGSAAETSDIPPLDASTPMEVSSAMKL